jgi:peroxiredoxin
MKRIGIVVLMLTVLFGCSDKNESYKIKGKISAAYNDYVYLYTYTDGIFEITDSAKAYNGEFEIQGIIDMPEIRYFAINGSNESYQFFLENAKIDMEVNIDSLQGSVLTGSTTQEIYQKYLEDNEVYNSQLSAIYKEYREASSAENQEKIDSLDAEYDEVKEKQGEFVKAFIAEHNSSVVAPYLIRSQLIYTIELEDLESLTSDLDLSIAESKYTKWLFKRIETLRKVALGEPFTDFTMNDIDGNPFALSELKGNIILVDFWASWCKPCRRENPNVVKLYEKYHSQGFDILGVSFDESYDDWLDAINDDRLTWNHVSDLKGWKNAAGKMYGVMSIPHTVLIDRNGNIAAKNLRGDELEAKVKELLEI